MYRNAVPTWGRVFPTERASLCSLCIHPFPWCGCLTAHYSGVDGGARPMPCGEGGLIEMSQLSHFWSQVLAVLTVAGHGHHINSIDPFFNSA